jgi:hypothetical protein
MNFTELVELRIYFEGNTKPAVKYQCWKYKTMLVIKNVGSFMKLLYLHYKTAVVKIFGQTQWGVTIYICIAGSLWRTELNVE